MDRRRAAARRTGRRAGSPARRRAPGRGRATWTIADDAGATCVKITADLDSDELHVTVADASGGTRSLIAPLPERDRHELRTFLDGSLLEVFIDGDRALTTRVYRVGASPVTVRVTRDGDLLADTVSAWTIDTNATPG